MSRFRPIIQLCALVLFMSLQVQGQEDEFVFSNEFEGPWLEDRQLNTYEDKGLLFFKAQMLGNKQVSVLTTIEGDKETVSDKVKVKNMDGMVSSVFVTPQGMFGTKHTKDSKSRSLKVDCCHLNKDGSTSVCKEIERFPLSKTADVPYENVYQSKSKKHTAIVHTLDEGLENRKFKISISLLDENSNLVNSTEFAPNETNGQILFNNDGGALAEDGTYYQLILSLSSAEKNKNMAKSNYTLKVLAIGQTGESEMYDLDTGGSFMNTPKIFINSNNKPLVVVNPLRKEDKSELVTGIDVHLFDKEAGAFKRVRNTFTEDQITKYGIGDWGKYRKNKTDWYRVQDSYIADGDKLHFFMERNYVYSSSYNNGKQMVYEHWFHHEAAVVYTINQDGKIVNEYYVPKFYRNRYPGPALLQLRKGEPSLLYLDYAKNIEVDSDDYRDYVPNKVKLVERDNFTRAWNEGGALKRKTFDMSEKKASLPDLALAQFCPNGDIKILLYEPNGLAKVTIKLGTLKLIK